MITNELVNSYLLKEPQKRRELFFWQMRDNLARRWSSLIWGNSYVFETDNEELKKFFYKFERLNQFSSQMSFIEKELSKFGRCIVLLNKTKTGDIVMNVANQNWYNGIAKVVVQPQVAVVWQNYTIGNTSYLVKTKYTIKKVVNEVYSGQEDNVSIIDEDGPILEKLQLEKEWNHNFGFLPLVEFVNIPHHQFWNNLFQFSHLADWVNGIEFEKLAYSTLTNLRKELKYCHSRLLFENAPQSLIDQVGLMLDEDGDHDMGDMVLETMTGADVKIQPGMGDFTKYVATFEGIMDCYFKFSGMSRFSEGGGAQKTVAETATVRSQMIESTNQKIMLRQQQTTDLLRKLFAANGMLDYYESDDSDFNFKINGNVLKDETSFIDNQMKLIQMNAASPVSLIQEVKNITEEEATKLVEKYRTYNEENNLFNGFEVEQGEESSSGFNKETGTHQDPAKQGAR